MESKAPIPIPPAQRWREFRIQLLPVLVFVLLTIAIAVLWKQVHGTATMVGEVSTTHFQVRSLVDGTIHELTAEPFTFVRKGDVIGSVLPTLSQNLQAETAMAVAEGELERLRTDVVLNNNLFQQSNLQFNRQKVASDLEIGRADMALRKAEFDRAKEMLAKDLTTQVLYDLANSTYQKAKTTVEQLEQTLKVYETQEKNLQAGQKSITPELQARVIDSLIHSRSNALNVAYKLSPLVAPADGIISSNMFRAGERIRVGDPVATIVATNLTHIIGYLRQSSVVTLKINDEVRVRSRLFPGPSGTARILKIGADVQFINPALQVTDPTRREQALQVLVSIPGDITLRPGEFVDISLVTK